MQNESFHILAQDVVYRRDGENLTLKKETWKFEILGKLNNASFFISSNPTHLHIFQRIKTVKNPRSIFDMNRRIIRQFQIFYCICYLRSHIIARFPGNRQTLSETFLTALFSTTLCKTFKQTRCRQGYSTNTYVTDQVGHSFVQVSLKHLHTKPV